MDNRTFIQQQWVKDEIISRLNYDTDTGLLTWARRGVEWLDKRIVGKEVSQKWVDKTGYKQYVVTLEIKGTKVRIPAARLCWLVHTGGWPVSTVDHINRDPFDNRFCNLRDVSQKVNNFNRGFYKGNVFTYIRFHKGVWRVDFRGKYVGSSACLGLALKVRNTELKKQGIFNLTNTIESPI